MKIARENLKTFLNNQARKHIVSAVFKKKDQSTRKMAFRLGVKKNLRGGTNKVEALERSYMTVFDMNKNDYRTLNLATVEKIKTDGVTYVVV